MMSIKLKSFKYLLLLTGIIALTGCSAATSSTQQQHVETSAQTSTKQPAQPPAQSSTLTAIQPSVQPVAQTPAQQNSGSGSISTANTVTSTHVLSNRIDVVYFHANIRCVTCLCFEKEVTNIIKTYFQDAINSGKLTYRVLNIQEPKNAGIAKKYSAIGSQLFINTVTNDFDNIEDIQDIWSWNCVDNPAGFDMKVKNIVELRLKGQR